MGQSKMTWWDVDASLLRHVAEKIMRNDAIFSLMYGANGKYLKFAINQNGKYSYRSAETVARMQEILYEYINYPN